MLRVRGSLLPILAVLLLAGAAWAQNLPGPLNAITDVGGIKVGSYQERLTGTTVILLPPGTVGGVDVRGSAPGTRETDLLRPLNKVDRVDAFMLSGGSAYGLAAADGVMLWLEEQGQGWPVGGGHVVPIVPAAILYDPGRFGREFSFRPTAAFSPEKVQGGKPAGGQRASGRFPDRPLQRPGAGEEHHHRGGGHQCAADQGPSPEDRPDGP